MIEKMMLILIILGVSTSMISAEQLMVEGETERWTRKALRVVERGMLGMSQERTNVMPDTLSFSGPNLFPAE